MRPELVDLRGAVEKARTVVWANEPACTLPNVAVALVEAGSVLDAVTVDAVAALDASKEHKATGDFSPADLLRRRCRAEHDTVTRLQRAARRLRTMPHTAEAFGAGSITLDHVDVLIRANTSKLAELFARDEELLVGYALDRTFDGFRTDVDAWVAAVRPDDAEERAARHDDERSIHLSEDVRQRSLSSDAKLVVHCCHMGLRDTLRQAKEAMSPDAIKQGLGSFGHAPSEEELAAARAAMTPEQQAAYDAQVAQIAAAQQQAAAAQQQAIEASDAYRVLGGPAGEQLYGPSASDQMAVLQTGGIGGVLKMTAQQFGRELKGAYSSPAKPESDLAIAAAAAAAEWQQRAAARAPYLAPERWPTVITRIATRGRTQVEELGTYLAHCGLSARPDLVYGVYRVPDRISPAVTSTSEAGRVVEWDIVHAGLPGTPGPLPAVAWFPAGERWVARRSGEPSVLDEDLATAYLARAGVPPEATLGIARFPSFVEPKDRWFAIDGGGGGLGGGTEDGYPIVPVVEGVVVLHPGDDPTPLVEELRRAAPFALDAGPLAGAHVEVLNWEAIADVQHPRPQHPAPTPSPFPYLPSTPQELLLAYLDVVGVRPFDATSAQVTIDQPFALYGRIWMGSTNIGSAQPCADGKARRRLHGATRVVVAYRDRPEYAEGRARWQRYQAEVLQAHLERRTDVRGPVLGPSGLPDNPVLRAGAKLWDVAAELSSVGQWKAPPPYRYCWPLVDAPT